MRKPCWWDLGYDNAGLLEPFAESLKLLRGNGLQENLPLTNENNSDRLITMDTQTDSNYEEWITVNGTPIRLEEGQSKSEAAENFINSKESERGSGKHENESGQNPLANDIVKNELSRLQKLGRETGNEHVSILADDGRVIGRSEGQREQVEVTSEMLSEIRLSPPNSLVIAHNHPGVGSLSDEDLSFLAYPSVKAVCAVEPGGTYYTMNVGSGERPSATEIMQSGQMFDRIVGSKQRDMIICGDITAEQAFQRHNDEKCKIFAEKYGWTYERGITDG